MNTKLFSAAPVAAAFFLLPLPGQAGIVIAHDKADDPAYAAGYNGQNGGTGFGAFNAVGTGSAGTFIYTAANSEGGINPAAIDSNGVSFGVYANNNNGNAFSSETITRAFNTPLEGTLPGLQTAGDSFSLDFVGGDSAGGNVNVSLLSGTTRVGIFNYNGSNGNFEFNGAATGATFAPGPLHLVYTLNSPTTYSFTSTGAATVNETGTFSSPITGFELQQENAGIDNGTGNRDAYFNNLSVTADSPSPAPEPSQMATLTLVGLGLGGLLLRRQSLRTKAAS